MEKQYNRVDNLDELIRSVKLPYLAWKVLFMVNKNTQIEEVAKMLEADEPAVGNAVQQLINKGLIRPADEDKDKQEQETAPAEKAAEPEPVVEEEEDEPAAAEEAAAEQEQDTEEAEVAEEPLTAVEEEISEEEAEAETEQDAETTQEEPKVEEEEQAQGEESEAPELVEEEIEEIDEAGSQEESAEKESEQEAEAEEAASEEKIEINIPEDDAQDDISKEMEFNFNLTDEEIAEQEEKDAEAEQAPPEAAAEEVDKSGYKKVLVIDDSLVIRKMVEIALEEEELIIETAVSGKEGLDVIDQINPNLVILDMMLPDINGIEILKTIKASKGIPVIMLSGKDSPQMIENAKAEGAEEFLPKPFKDDDLVDKVKKLIS